MQKATVRIVSHFRSAALLFAIVAAALAVGTGCGGDSGSEPTPTPTCAISGVNTSIEDSWLTGETVSILWTQNGVPATVKIELLKGGAVVGTIAASTPNDGAHFWLASTGGQINGSDFGIRVTGNGVTGCSAEIGGLTIIDVSGCNLQFTAAVDTINAGEQFELTWDTFHSSTQVDIELYKSMPNSLGDYVGTIAYGADDSGSYTWTVDSFNVGTLLYRYRIADTQVGGCETISGPFRIIDDVVCTITVTGPGDSSTHNEGTTLVLDVDQTNGSGVVTLRLYAGEVAVPGGTIVANLSVLNSYNWVVNDFGWTLSNSAYKIKAFDVADDYCVGETGRFTIVNIP